MGFWGYVHLCCNEHDVTGSLASTTAGMSTALLIRTLKEQEGNLGPQIRTSRCELWRESAYASCKQVKLGDTRRRLIGRRMCPGEVIVEIKRS